MSVLAFLRGLTADYHAECTVATGFHRAARTSHRGIPVRTYRHIVELERLVERQRPDCILSSLDGDLDAVRVAGRYGVPVVVSLRSFEYCAPSADEIERWGVSAMRRYPSDDVAERILAGADLLVANSRFLQSRFERLRGVRPRVLFPAIDPVDLVVPEAHDGGAITAVSGHRYKGAEIVLALADLFPNERFLVAGAIDPALAREFAARPNVESCGWISTPRLLARSKIVLVPSQWPEPFGRIAIEAMTNGIPTLASETGGLVEIVGSTPLAVRDFHRPEVWAMRLGALLASDALRREYVEAGRRAAGPFVGGDSVRELATTLREICARKQPRYEGPRCVVVCGASTRPTAYSAVNARWIEALSTSDSVEMVGAARSHDLRFELPDVVVHHDYEDSFSSAEFPDSGHLVAVRTWDFGPFPRAWATRINEECDQLWVYSRWVRRLAIAGGVLARKIAVVPLGIDETIFRPEGPTYPLATRKSFRFLFVGAPVARKGADILVKAYARAFGPEDDVCLVIKDHSNDVFYSDGGVRERIHEMRRDPLAPEIEYVDEFLSTERVAALIRACDCGVFPYRAEGFCLPILEAMATGVPSIVPRFGASLDYCTESTSIRVPTQRIALPVGRMFAFNSLGFSETVEQVDFCEVSVDTLADHLRRARAMGTRALHHLARAGVERAHSRFRWRDSADRVEALLERIGRGQVPCRVRKRISEAFAEAERLGAARALYLETLLGGR